MTGVESVKYDLNGTDPAAAVNRVNVHVSEAEPLHLRRDSIERRVVGIPRSPQEGRAALGGWFPRRRHFCENRVPERTPIYRTITVLARQNHLQRFTST